MSSPGESCNCWSAVPAGTAPENSGSDPLPSIPWDLVDVKKDKPGREVHRAEEPGVAEGLRGQAVQHPPDSR